MTRCIMLVFACLAAAPATTAARVGLRSTSKSATSAPQLSEDARFAALGAVGSLSPGETDVMMHEGLGENRPYPGSDFLGMGYNIFKGNPDGDDGGMDDPGWAAPVLRFPWCQDLQCLSADLKFLRPTDLNKNPIGWASSDVSCEMVTTASTMKSMTEYSAFLAQDVDIGKEIEGSAPFFASKGFGRFQEGVAEGSRTQYKMKSYCSQFRIGVPRKSYVSLQDPIFKQHLHLLSHSPATNDAYKRRWFMFFDVYGTHLAVGLTLGGKHVTTMTVEEKSGARVSVSELSNAVSASYEGAVYGKSTPIRTQASQASMTALSSMTRKSHVSVYGGLPPAEHELGSWQGFGAWSASVPSRPMPIKYRLCRLDVCAGVNQAHFLLATRMYAAHLRELSGSAGPVHVGLPKPLPSPRPNFDVADHITCGERLYPGEFLTSQNGRIRAGFDSDLNFMIWHRAGDIWVAHWQARTGLRTQGKGIDHMTANPNRRRSNAYLVMGNMCRAFIMMHGKRIWNSHASRTEECRKGDTGGLALSNNGQLYIATHWNTCTWRSGMGMDSTATALGFNIKEINCHRSKGFADFPYGGEACKNMPGDWQWGCNSFSDTRCQ